MGAGDQIGAKVGPRLAEIVHRAKIAATERLAPHHRALGAQILTDFFDLVDSEIDATVAPVWHKIADHPDAPDWLHNTAQFAGRGRGQWKTLLTGTAVGAAMGGGIGDLITNEMRPVIGALIAGNPHTPLSPDVAANAQVRGLSWGPNLATDAAQAGFNDDRFRVLEGLASQTLDAEQIIDLLNRGTITGTEADAYLRRAGWDHDHGQLYLQTRRPLLSVQDLAAMWNRQIVTTAQGHALAAKQGWAPEDFDRFAQLGGEPPDLTSIILAWRRGIIDEAQVDRAIVQGPIRFEWIPVVKALQWEPLPVTEAANAVNQGHLSMAAATKAAQENGVRPADFDVIVRNAGRPPGPIEALQWLNRGLITQEKFRQIFLESSLKNEYIDLYLSTRHRVVPMSTVRSAYRHGGISEAEAIRLLQEDGYDDAGARVVLKAGAGERTATVRHLSMTQIVALYETQVLTADAARTMLVDLGYTVDDVAWMFELADVRRTQRTIDAGVSVVRSRFVAHRIDESEASTTLDGLGVPHERRDTLIQLWTLERQVSTKDLTPAQIVKAAHDGHLDVAAALARLMGQGYHDADAKILLLNAKVPGADAL